MPESVNFMEMFMLGQEEGLQYFMRKFGNHLRFFSFKIIRNKEVAEEIVSESFYKLWQRRSKFHSADHVKSFLYVVTRNASMDYLKSLSRQTVPLSEEEFKAVSHDFDILSQIIYIELLEQVKDEIQKLPEQQAAVFRMSFLEGFNTQEICEQLGTTAGNVYYAKSKAMSALRSIFNKNGISLYTILILLCPIG